MSASISPGVKWSGTRRRGHEAAAAAVCSALSGGPDLGVPAYCGGLIQMAQ